MITAIHEGAPAGASCRYDERPAVASYYSDDGRTDVPVCAECLARARPAYERAETGVLALAAGSAITRAQADDLAAALTRAGDRWEQAAGELPLIEATRPATERTWPHTVLSVDVVEGGLLYESVLYNDGTGWRATGWSDASRSRVYRHGLPEDRGRDDDRAQ